jgi:hypothetical protein
MGRRRKSLTRLELSDFPEISEHRKRACVWGVGRGWWRQPVEQFASGPLVSPIRIPLCRQQPAIWPHEARCFKAHAARRKWVSVKREHRLFTVAGGARS